MYKASILRLINSGMGVSKSGDKLRRVQGYVISTAYEVRSTEITFLPYQYDI